MKCRSHRGRDESSSENDESICSDDELFDGPSTSNSIRSTTRSNTAGARTPSTAQTRQRKKSKSRGRSISRSRQSTPKPRRN